MVLGLKTRFLHIFLLVFICFGLIFILNVKAQDYSSFQCPMPGSISVDSTGVVHSNQTEFGENNAAGYTQERIDQINNSSPAEKEAFKQKLKEDCGIEQAPSVLTPAVSAPIMFIPEVGFPGFSGPITIDGYAFGKFIFALFNYLIYVSGILAVIFVSISGFKWVSAGGNQTKISAAKNQMINSITGMFLVFATFLILSTINEELVIMKEIKLETIDIVELEDANMAEVGGYRTTGCPDRGIDPSANCSGADIEKAAKELLGKASGPCHCACFVSGVLKKAGCNSTIRTNTTQLKNDILSAWRSSTDKNYNPKLGDIIYTKQHIVISLGGNSIIHSGGVDSSSNCGKESLSCNNSWHGLMGDKRLWAGGGCNTNQVIKIGTNSFLKGKDFTDYTVLIRPGN